MRPAINTFLLITIILRGTVECAKILAIFPSCGPSQYYAAKPYLEALAARGHELTVISQHPQKRVVPNYKDITLHYEHYDEMVASYINADKSTITNLFFEHAKNITLLVLENPTVRGLLNSTTTEFDLIILETKLNEALFAFGPHFNAHLIGFSSFGTDGNIDPLVGNTSPVSYIPGMFTSLTDRMNFWHRLENLKSSLLFWYKIHFEMLPWQREVYKKYFPHLKDDLEAIRRNFSLVLLNQHFALSYARPYVPNMIEVGGLFIQEQRSKLPKEMADFLDESVDGVIYFSLGSNVKSEFLPNQTLQKLLKVFGSLKQRVMFKFERTELADKPRNVFISKWFPQADVLAHPNVKLFITHGGLLSTIEAIYYAKPMIALPIFFDQFLNAARAESAGFSITVDLKNFTEEQFKAAIERVLGNASFTRAVQKRSSLFHDQPIKPLEKAIFWTEYILRHNGAKHMRVAAQELNFWQNHSLDVVGFLFVMISLGILSAIRLFYCIFKYLCCRPKKIPMKNKVM